MTVEYEEQILRTSSVITRGNHQFLQTELPVIYKLFDCIPEEEFLLANEVCWLAGGSLLRWLSGCINRTKQSDMFYDRDFFFFSRQDLYTTYKKLISNGYQIVCFNVKERKFIHRKSIRAEDLNLQSMTSAQILSNRKITDIIFRKDLIVAELQSPQKKRYQLIGALHCNDPLGVIEQFDFTISQFATDGKNLYTGINTWNDLFHQKLSYIDKTVNLRTAWRVYKYTRMGYRPNVKCLAAAAKSLLLSPTFIGR